MMNKLSILMILLVTLIFGCSSPQYVLYRSSSDHLSEIMYLHPFIALTSYPANPNSESKTKKYELTKSHWLNEPELADQTGDTGSPLVLCVEEIGWFPGDGVVFGIGSDPKADVFDTSPTYFVLSLDRIEFYKSRSEMNDTLLHLGIRHAKCVRTDVFFNQQITQANQRVDFTRTEQRVGGFPMGKSE